MTNSTMHRIVAIGGAILLTLALSAALAAAQTSGAPTSAASYVPPSDSVSGQSMLELIVRANREAIQQARRVINGSRNPEVSRFAQTVADDHSGSLAGANALWDRHEYTRADTAGTLGAAAPSADSGLGGGLGGLADAGADNAWLTSQTAALESLVAQLKQRGPLVTSPTVRAFALEVQGTVEAELAEARRLQAPPRRPAQ